MDVFLRQAERRAGKFDNPSPLELPQSLRDKLLEFRGRVWRIKLIEAVCGALFGVLAAYGVMFVLDRFFDTPTWVRLTLFCVAVLGCAMVPGLVHRWIWRRRRLDQLARLLSQRHPSVGDQLLGVIELAQSDAEQARSRTLCEAAIRQVAEVARDRDFSDAVPNPKHRRWAVLAGVAATIAAALMTIVPDAAKNSWARFLAPWRDTPRYTFAQVEPLPDRIVVAHGEPFTLTVRLADTTVWRPERGVMRLAGQQPADVSLRDGAYHFELPPQIDSGWLHLRIGDLTKYVHVEPTLRPELTSLVADVNLPDYLGRPAALSKDVRGGAISLVSGSRATFVATASRELSTATVDGQPRTPHGAKITSPPADIADTRKVQFEWMDRFGLSGKEPFTLSVAGRPDEPPSLACEDLPRQKVLLDSEVLSFKVKTQDDFGIKQVGIDWQGVDSAIVKQPAKGERIIAAGGHEKESLELDGAFSAKSLGIEPQPVNVRLFVEDYFPGRERVYSPTYLFYVLNAEQHAIWLTEQLSKWHRQSLEVRDREMQLLETNKHLRALTPRELDLPDTRKRIEAQAAAEQANGRRLTNLVASGEELVRQASRNPEFGVGHLEKWAEMLQILRDISANRMPSVADMLRQAAQSPLAEASSSSTPQGPMVGNIRAAGQPKGSKGSPGSSKNASAIPTIADVESSQQPPDSKGGGPAPAGKSSPRLGLAQTQLMGASKPGGECPAGNAMDEAVTRQQDLLAEFEKVADELNRVLANLEGSTLVKRLKAQSRLQQTIAGRLGDQVADAFGVPGGLEQPQAKLFSELAEQQAKSSATVSTIMDDLLSYFDRRRLIKFRTVLDDMRKQDVVGNLRQLGDDLRKENALSMAQCEYWSDTLDRWAEDLVDPSSGGC